MAERVIIYESAIASLFNPGASGDAFMRSFLRETSGYARSIAPRRTTHLAMSHRTNGPFRRGRYRLRGQVVNTAAYAEFVHDGTRTPIRSTRARMRNDGHLVGGVMRLPTTGRSMATDPHGGAAFIYRREVRGQKANPWLDKAGTFVARKYLAGGYAVAPIYL